MSSETLFGNAFSLLEEHFDAYESASQGGDTASANASAASLALVMSEFSMALDNVEAYGDDFTTKRIDPNFTSPFISRLEEAFGKDAVTNSGVRGEINQYIVDRNHWLRDPHNTQKPSEINYAAKKMDMLRRVIRESANIASRATPLPTQGPLASGLQAQNVINSMGIFSSRTTHDHDQVVGQSIEYITQFGSTVPANSNNLDAAEKALRSYEEVFATACTEQGVNKITRLRLAIDAYKNQTSYNWDRILEETKRSEDFIVNNVKKVTECYTPAPPEFGWIKTNWIREFALHFYNAFERFNPLRLTNIVAVFREFTNPAKNENKANGADLYHVVEQHRKDIEFTQGQVRNELTDGQISDKMLRCVIKQHAADGELTLNHDNYSVDLSRIPNMTVDDWESRINEALEVLPPEHAEKFRADARSFIVNDSALNGLPVIEQKIIEAKLINEKLQSSLRQGLRKCYEKDAANFENKPRTEILSLNFLTKYKVSDEALDLIRRKNIKTGKPISSTQKHRVDFQNMYYAYNTIYKPLFLGGAARCNNPNIHIYREKRLRHAGQLSMARMSFPSRLINRVTGTLRKIPLVGIIFAPFHNPHGITASLDDTFTNHQKALHLLTVGMSETQELSEGTLENLYMSPSPASFRDVMARLSPGFMPIADWTGKQDEYTLLSRQLADDILRCCERFNKVTLSTTRLQNNSSRAMNQALKDMSIITSTAGDYLVYLSTLLNNSEATKSTLSYTEQAFGKGKSKGSDLEDIYDELSKTFRREVYEQFRNMVAPEGLYDEKTKTVNPWTLLGSNNMPALNLSGPQDINSLIPSNLSGIVATPDVRDEADNLYATLRSKGHRLVGSQTNGFVTQDSSGGYCVHIVDPTKKSILKSVQADIRAGRYDAISEYVTNSNAISSKMTRMFTLLSEISKARKDVKENQYLFKREALSSERAGNRILQTLARSGNFILSPLRWLQKENTTRAHSMDDSYVPRMNPDSQDPTSDLISELAPNETARQITMFEMARDPVYTQAMQTAARITASNAQAANQLQAFRRMAANVNG